ncbi:MAG: alpha/beta fold hydrolase [Myxococcales bacterium]|nr:alpha/beta fold hydrolase [Myxococcales bacterium]HIK85098.1 alpha/beta fold hydrolase [Myxococcales bacterium]
MPLDSTPPLSPRTNPHLAAVIACVFGAVFLMACASPVGVTRANPKKVRQELTATVLSTGSLSGSTRNFLRKNYMEELYEGEPVEAIALLHSKFVPAAIEGDPVAHAALLFLSELAFKLADDENDGKYFLSSLTYAWAYLFPRDESLNPSGYEPWLRFALDLYNRSLGRAFILRGAGEHAPQSGVLETGFGEINVTINPKSMVHGNVRFSSFIPIADLEVRGLQNRWRPRGIGASMAASTEPLDPHHASTKYLLDTLKVPVSFIAVFSDLYGQIMTGRVDARLEIVSGWGSRTIEIQGQTLPIELETTSSLAYMLTESPPWSRELAGFFQGDLARTGDGLFSLEPYKPGRIPVILVHGTASSSARWADVVNDLTNDPRIRDRYQFWLYTYNTGSPIPYSGYLLRSAIRDMVGSVDPDKQDPALNKIVVVGHSQGGLLTKLVSVQPENKMWKIFSNDSIDDLKLAPETREILQGSLLFDPVPNIGRVVFISTPHRGSYLAAFGIAKWMSSFVRAPANIAIAATDLITQNPEANGIEKVAEIGGAIGNMSPTNPMFNVLVDIPVRPGVHAHSIISVKGGEAAKDGGSDGVVKYESAHLEGVASELIVDSPHSCQSKAPVIEELLRILLLHLDESEESNISEVRQPLEL